MTNKERIEQLEEELKNLKKEQEDLKKYAKIKESIDDATIQLAMVRDSMKDNGFTDEQAFEMIKTMMAKNHITNFRF